MTPIIRWHILIYELVGINTNFQLTIFLHTVNINLNFRVAILTSLQPKHTHDAALMLSNISKNLI